VLIGLLVVAVLVAQLRPQEQAVPPVRSAPTTTPVPAAPPTAIVSVMMFGEGSRWGRPLELEAAGGTVWLALADLTGQDDSLFQVDPRPRGGSISFDGGSDMVGAELAFGVAWTIDGEGVLRKSSLRTGLPLFETGVVDPATNQVTGRLALDEAPRTMTVARGLLWVTTERAVLQIDPDKL
jgi:hypothetical protein